MLRREENEQAAVLIAELRATEGMECPVHGRSHVGITICGECGRSLEWPKAGGS